MVTHAKFKEKSAENGRLHAGGDDGAIIGFSRERDKQPH
jgi:hypothetical protein